MVSHSGSLQHGREGAQVDKKTSFTFTKTVGCSGSGLCVCIDTEEVLEVPESRDTENFNSMIPQAQWKVGDLRPLCSGWSPDPWK